MNPELQILFAVLGLVVGPAAAALGAWGAVKYYFGRVTAQIEAHHERLDEHHERLLFLERN